jgi:hypothetical protein
MKRGCTAFLERKPPQGADSTWASAHKVLPLDSPLEFELEIEARYFGGLTSQNETLDTTQAKSFVAKPEDSRNIAIDNVRIDTVEIRY